MNVRLVDGPINGYTAINLNIQKVEINGPNGWVTLSTPNKTVNLLDLTGGVSETLASGVSLGAGHYGQMRLVLGSGNSVTLSDNSTHDLTTPSGMQSGIKLVVSFDVQAGTTEDVFIDFDAAHSIQITQTGTGSNKYILRPTIRAFDQVVTGSISGTLTDSVSGAALAGATVYAETLDGSNDGVIARTVVTDASGHYTLDLLPVGGTYFVVSQPIVGSVAYNAAASQGFAVTSGMATFTFNGSYTAAVATGGVSGSFATAATADQSDTVDLLQGLAEGGSATTANFVVQSQIATVTTTGETYAFATVPVGGYLVRNTRTTFAADGTTSSTATVSPSISVAATLTTTVN
ncbi:MAG TPA: DUF4382 domain-containing protein, partial [Holophagaceae bacterium]|nr:DUF4382 domain-containing protein [Holophagaceae bacterium]